MQLVEIDEINGGQLTAIGGLIPDSLQRRTVWSRYAALTSARLPHSRALTLLGAAAGAASRIRQALRQTAELPLGEERQTMPNHALELCLCRKLSHGVLSGASRLFRAEAEPTQRSHRAFAEQFGRRRYQ